MGKKMKFPSLFKSPDSAAAAAAATAAATTSWRWPSCKNPETHSFRAATTPGAADIFKTMNSAYDTEEELEDPGGGGGEEVEAVISGLRAAKRFFFEPGETSSIMTESRGGEDKYCLTMFVNKENEDDENEGHFGQLKESSGGVEVAMDFFEEGESSSTMADSRGGEDKHCLTSSKFNEEDEEEEGECGGHFGQMRERSRSVAVAMDSMDPYGDFKRSMEEMVEAHGLKDFEGLQELLGWYLKANGKESHGYVVGAFVDLLVGLAFDSSSSSCDDDDDDDDDDHDQDQCFSMISSIACSLNSPLSFSSSINTSSSTSTSTPCLSSLEAEDEIVKTVDSSC